MSQLIVNQTGVSNHNGVFYNPSNIDATYFDTAPNILNVCKSAMSGGAYYRYISFWLRFQLNLATAVTLESCYLKLTTPYGWGDTFSSGGTIAPEWTATINAHLSLNSAGPASHADAVSFSGASATVAGTRWTSQRYGVGATIFSPDFKSVIRELLDQGGWASGNYITLFVVPDVPSISYPGSSRLSYITNKKFQDDNPSWPSAPWVLEEDARPELVINYTVDTPLPGVYDQYVEHELEIVQYYSNTTGKYELYNTLVIEQDIAFVHDKIRSVVDTIEVTQTFKRVLPYELSVMSFVFCQQTISRSVAKSLDVESELTITQDIIGQTKFDKTLIHTLTVENDEVSVARAYSRQTEHTVVLEQTTVSNIKTKSIVHGVRVEHSVTTDGSDLSALEVVTVLTIEQDIDYNRIGNRECEHTLTIEQSVLGYFEERAGCERLDINYSPFADSSVAFPTEPVLSEPTDITLAYPHTSPTLTVTLPVPLFGDREEILVTRIQRQTRGGVLKTFSSDVWPKVRTFRYKFEHLTTAKIEEMFTFLGTSLGMKIRLTDHEGRLWYGYIVNPQGEAGQFMNHCGNTTEFDFEGVEV